MCTFNFNLLQSNFYQILTDSAVLVISGLCTCSQLCDILPSKHAAITFTILLSFHCAVDIGKIECCLLYFWKPSWPHFRFQLPFFHFFANFDIMIFLIRTMACRHICLLFHWREVLYVNDQQNRFYNFGF